MSFLVFCSARPFRFRTENGCQKQPAFRRQRCAECRCGICLRPKSTFDLSGSIRPWKRTEGYVNKYWLIQPEYRYWTCQKFNGSFGEPISTERSST